MKVTLLVGLAATSEAAHLSRKQEALPGLGRETLISIPYRSYKNDCWKKRPVSTSFIQKNPGVGMKLDDIEPFVTVEKDGFMMIGCIKDTLYEHGDKHGNNKMAYKMGPTANVSIVHLNDFVPKEDRVLTTHATCFEFCRTVPGMNFFGIQNGRDCYCEPYFDAMGADMDGADCDSVCEGDTALMCGGKAKSNIFEMHSCDHTEAQLGTAKESIAEVMDSLQGIAENLKQATEQGEAAANTLQEIFGAAGDPDASTLCQDAKVYAGELIHLSEDAEKLLDSGEELRLEAGNLQGKNFKQLENAKAAEKNIQEINDAITELTEMEEQVQAAVDEAHPDTSESDEERLLQYVPIMTFATKSLYGGQDTDVPSTCTGKTVQLMFDESEATCAAKCDDALTRGCTAFQYFGEGGLCFLFSNVRKAQYYAGCRPEIQEEEEQQARFMQKKAKAALKDQKKKQGMEPFPAKCMVKSKDFQNVGDLMNQLFENTAHVNSYGLQELTRAERCYG